MRISRRLGTRLPVLLAAAATPVLLVAGAASAHVTVNAVGATQGGFSELSFRVPNETDNTDTTKVAVFFPTDQPLAAVSVQPHPGWSYRIKMTKLDQPISSDDGQVTSAVSQITWTADSKATSLHPGEFDDFNVSAGPLPKSPTMVFKALQTYSDGTVVRWIETSSPGQDEPEHPAPTLALAPASSGGTDETATTPTTSTSASDGSSGDGTATTSLVLAIVALVVAVGAGATSVLRRSRS